WIADQLAILHHRIRGKDHWQEERLEASARLAADARDLALSRVAASGNGKLLTRDRHVDGRHLVESERPGRVWVDGRGSPQCLDRSQAFDDGASGSQRGRPRREQICHGRGQPSRDGGDGERNGGDKKNVEWLVAHITECDRYHQRHNSYR